MTLQEKYDPAMQLAYDFGMDNIETRTEDGKFKVWGTLDTQYQKDIVWDKIKKIGGEVPTDLMADLKVADSSVYHRHTVTKGETLSKIAEHYYGDPMKYKEIYSANRDKIDNPDMIYPDQEFVIPNI